MKRVIQHKNLGEITYEESAWTGRKSISINGKNLNKVSKNVFQLSDEETITLKGNFFRGTTATVGSETIVLTPPYKWYEYVLSVIPFILIIIWGNSVALCKIVPVVGGAIGGLISGLCVAINLIFIKKVNNIFIKILISIVVTGICFLFCYLIALAILAA